MPHAELAGPPRNSTSSQLALAGAPKAKPISQTRKIGAWDAQ